MNHDRTRSLFQPRWGVLVIWFFFVISQSASAVEIVLERTAVQSLLKRALFNGPHQRMYLNPDPCYAYLEDPTVRLMGGRLLISGHLSSRVGIAAGDSCIGFGLASDFMVSGKPAFENGVLVLEDLRVDEVNDRWTDLFQQALLPRLPRAIQFDLQTAVKGFLHTAQGDPQPVMNNFSILALTAESNQLVVRLDFKLTVR